MLNEVKLWSQLMNDQRIEPRYDPATLRRVMEDIPPRDPQHEIAPYVPPPDKTSGDKIADRSLAILDEAASLTLQQLQQLKDQISELEQVILNSQVTVREVVRAHMAITQQAMDSCRLIAQQIVEAAQNLASQQK